MEPKVKVAVTLVLEVMVRVHVGEDPEHASDQPVVQPRQRSHNKLI